ncbi:DUF5302 domain-containing protein [Kineosporia sp. J2-2]|uniref:DUF5302 domain-containing protein n=1 Tax=Kineosporia corallincola TaxID=2835133 RepID=A0ABS5T8C0_9ACTN|nr:DUF5302 domain-containing protein [Kineosporia corallincola]MBT0767328.1 DUF5302 domain-containing protein [Kineosporia corallincola]
MPDSHVDSDTKRKFREALQRKHANDGLHRPEVAGGGKVGGAHGPETSGSQQMFRRKSGS